LIFFLLALDGKLDDWKLWKEVLKEFILVIGAAFLVSMYFENRLRGEISHEFNTILETKDEFARAGIVKYYASFDDVNLPSFFSRKPGKIDIYLTYGLSLFNGILPQLKEAAKRRDLEINIYMFSTANPFLDGLGQLWGKTNPDYSTERLKEKIDESKRLLDTLFTQLKTAGELKANITITQLKRHLVFYSFYRFDDEIVYVPSKLVEDKSYRPISFLVRRTGGLEGIYNKCLHELAIIKADKESNETSHYLEKE
jgi:hypothetical protein